MTTLRTARASAVDMLRLGLALGGVAVVTLVEGVWLHVGNATTVALSYLLVVLIVAAASRLWIAVLTSCAAMLAFNFFFLPPVGTFTIADPQNWVALLSFLAVSLVASRLSSIARDRQQDALARRDELARLFDLSRDVLLTTESRDAIPLLARYIARRFELDYAAICLPAQGAWDIFDSGPVALTLDTRRLALAFQRTDEGVDFDARARTYTAHEAMTVNGHEVHLVPLRLGTKAVGLLAATGGVVEPGTLHALAGVAAIAIERAQFLDERKTADLARQSEELKSALLASLAHDLRTPLTAIRVAAANLQASWLTPDQRRDQSDLILREIERLTRLFQNILEMARIDAGAIAADRRWVHPLQIVEAARGQVEHTLRDRSVTVTVETDCLVQLDPRLTAAALAHLLENAVQYAPATSRVDIVAAVDGGELLLRVRDRGPGIAAADLPHLFERFYRGSSAKVHPSGTGMGLSIARGFLAAEGGRVWAENCRDGGAQFTIAVPAAMKQADAAVASSA